MENNNKEQELMFKFSLFEQQIKQLQEQLQVIESAVSETTHLNEGLNELKNGKDKQVFASLGKGIFVKSKIDEEGLLVDIGGGNFVKKSVSETQDLIKKQIEKLEKVKKELGNKLEEVNSELTKTFIEAQNRDK